jgi:hypothetical protein
MAKYSAGSHRTVAWMAAAVVGLLLLPVGLYALARVNPGLPAGAIDLDAATTGASARESAAAAAAEVTPANAQAVAPGAARARRAGCGECGVVVAVRRVDRGAGGDLRHDGGARAGWPEAAPVARTLIAEREPAAATVEYEITVRFRDGSTTVLTERGMPTWRAGGRAIVIGGAKLARR